MRSPILIGGAFAASLTLAGPAAAVPSVATDRGCYAAGQDTITFTGQGFTAGGQVALLFAHNGKIGSATTTADPTGAFTTRLNAPSAKDFDEQQTAFDLDFTANDQAKFGPDGPIGPPEETVAIGRVRLSEWELAIPAFDRAPGATVKRAQKVKVVTTGWTAPGKTVYVHYVRGGRAVRSEKLGTLTTPCGDLTAPLKLFTFKTAKPGTYNLRFSLSARWSAKDSWLGYRNVKLAK